MTSLTEFAALPLADLTAELERMLENHDAPRRAYAARTFPTVTRIGQDDLSPADPAACGELIEVIA